MKQSQCAFEEKIAQASGSGQWSDALHAHVAACRSCEELALVTAFLHASSETSSRNSPLPAPDAVWLKAQCSARTAAMERALRPIVWAKRFAFATCAAALVAVWFAWRIDLASFVGNVAQSLSHPSGPAPAAQGNSLLLLMAAFLLLLVPLVLGLYSAWAQD